MDQSTGKIPPRLAEIIEDFQWAEDREKVELLLQYSQDLPALPEQLANNKSSMDQVQECMTPVFVQAENNNDGMIFHFDVPESSPTVRGFASILKQGLDGLSPEEILNVPNDFFREMGLDGVLSYQRLNGIAAILAHMKRLAIEEVGP